MKKAHCILFALILVINACNLKTKDYDNKAEITDSLYCKNQLELITSVDSIPKILLDLRNTSDSCLAYIQSFFNYNICDRKVYYAIPIDIKSKSIDQTENSIDLKIRLVNHCEWYHEDIRSTIQIRVNNNAEVLIEGEYALQDSLIHLIPHYYLHDEYSLIKQVENSTIELKYDNQVNIEKLITILSYVIKGYLSTVEEFSNIEFQKQLCQLTSSELKVVKNKLPFEFEIVFNNWKLRPLIPNDFE